MSDLIPFRFHDATVSTITDDQKNPWFIASEVCVALGIRNVSQALSRLDTDEKDAITLNDALHSELKTLIINESGLYSLVLSSRKKVAKEFKHWVTHDVLPAIRKTGQYQEPSRVPQVKDPAIQMLIDMAVHLDEARTLAAQANAKADLAMASQQWLTIRQYCFLHKLDRQMPESSKKAYGNWLTGHCLEQGIPVEDRGVGDRHYKTEHAYHAETITQTLPGWLLRREGQLDIYRVK